VNLYSAFS